MSRQIKLPSVPRVATKDAALNRALTAIRQVLEIYRNGGDDRVVTWRDLEDVGLIEQSSTTIIVSGGSGGSTTPPSAPSGLGVTPIGLGLQLAWTASASADIHYYEVWRHTSDALGSASLIGTAISTRYTDVLGAAGTTYYYWVRAVSTGGTPGSFNATAGTSATSASPGGMQPLDDDLTDIAALTHTKGNVMVSDGTDWKNVGVGADGQVLRADSSASEGVAWKYERHLLGTISGGTTGSLLGELTGIPADCNRIMLLLKDLSATNSTAQHVSLELGDSGGYSATHEGVYGFSRYNGSSNNGGAVKWPSTAAYCINLSAAADYAHGTVFLEKVDGTNEWTVMGTLGEYVGSTYRVGSPSGMITNTAAIDRLKITLSTNNFDSGSVQVYIWTA